ncbi:hypothetical protein OnM2_086047 [Erysiphe neolycopersici]|uniref:Uncharacterized protein n=1 Tax=Erysiphe neolycopersici TaxID=212602 RepID=A0A420HET1_9PEZI|nr:hypothetical protein OnM2_086047 [Erysiphe neolycopersici]
MVDSLESDEPIKNASKIETRRQAKKKSQRPRSNKDQSSTQVEPKLTGNIDNSDDTKGQDRIQELEKSEQEPRILGVDSENAHADDDTNDARNKMRVLKTADHIVDFKDSNSKALVHVLQKFVAVGSLVHKLTPDELKIIASFDGNYPNKEEKKVTIIDGKKVPNSVEGLLANGTKFFDAVVYLGMEVERRPKPIDIQFEKAKDGSIEIPTYDDMAKLTTYIFVAFFFIVIRAHPSSDSGVYVNQPMPNLIRNIMNCKASISEISDYISTFDLINLSPGWVKYIPTKSINQEAVNRLGLAVAGYLLVSVFNVIAPYLYLEEGEEDNGRSDPSKDKGKVNDSDGKKRRYKLDPSEPYKYQIKPKYLDTVVSVMRSFKQAGYCWDFHPATRSPDVMSKYRNINKNASNLLLECYKTKTLENLRKIKKLAIMPVFDPSHTEYRTWTIGMTYEATNKIFKKDKTYSISI